MSQLGQSIAEYKIIKTIGRGNFGVVSLVTHNRDGRMYVLKAIAMNELSDSEREGCVQEVKLLSELRHPLIVTYKTSFLEGDNLYIIMHYCENGDMTGLIKSRGQEYFEERQIMVWFVQIALALQYCHQRKIIHRDLKTQNIFLTRKNNIRLGDFGIARVLNGTTEMAMTVVGTPYSMSPEVCENKPYSYKSDIWALGCVLYEMCVLKHAFDANNLLGLVWKIVQENYPPIPDIYSDDLRHLVDAMLCKDPNMRPSIDEIIEMPIVTAILQEQIVAQTAGVKTSSLKAKIRSRPQTSTRPRTTNKEATTFDTTLKQSDMKISQPSNHTPRVSRKPSRGDDVNPLERTKVQPVRERPRTTSASSQRTRQQQQQQQQDDRKSPTKKPQRPPSASTLMSVREAAKRRKEEQIAQRTAELNAQMRRDGASTREIRKERITKEFRGNLDTTLDMTQANPNLYGGGRENSSREANTPTRRSGDDAYRPRSGEPVRPNSRPNSREVYPHYDDDGREEYGYTRRASHERTNSRPSSGRYDNGPRRYYSDEGTDDSQYEESDDDERGYIRRSHSSQQQQGGQQRYSNDGYSQQQQQHQRRPSQSQDFYEDRRPIRPLQQNNPTAPSLPRRGSYEDRSDSGNSRPSSTQSSEMRSSNSWEDKPIKSTGKYSFDADMQSPFVSEFDKTRRQNPSHHSGPMGGSGDDGEGGYSDEEFEEYLSDFDNPNEEEDIQHVMQQKLDQKTKSPAPPKSPTKKKTSTSPTKKSSTRPTSGKSKENEPLVSPHTLAPPSMSKKLQAMKDKCLRTISSTQFDALLHIFETLHESKDKTKLASAKKKLASDEFVSLDRNALMLVEHYAFLASH